MLKLRAEFTDMLVFGQNLLNLRQGARAPMPRPNFLFWNNLVLASPLSGLAPFLGYPGFPTAIAHRLWCFFLFSINQKGKKRERQKISMVTVSQVINKEKNRNSTT